jgi:WhiB family redox-sensing transcriptional regulator
MSETFAERIGTLSADEIEWQEEAVCAQTDPEVFFPEKGGSVREAKKVCLGGCAVKEQCLNFALTNDEKFGVWGGLTERERRKIYKQRKALDEAAGLQSL